MVYIHEAHASDAWQLPVNVKDNVVYATPKSANERGEVAGACVRGLKIQLPALVDGIDDAVEKAYTAWPDRLYLVDREGRIAYKSAPGPYGFRPADLETALARIAPRS